MGRRVKFREHAYYFNIELLFFVAQRATPQCYLLCALLYTLYICLSS